MAARTARSFLFFFAIMGWSESLQAANAANLRTFGEPAVYQPVAEGAPSGPPLTVTVIRQSRDQTELQGNYEQAWGTVGPGTGQFPAPPQKGDLFTIAAVDYVVHLVKPDQDSGSDGWRMYLAKRNPNHA